jgi:hypothetical protein
MKLVYPILAVLMTSNAFWAKQIHSSLGVTYMRLLMVTSDKTDPLKQIFLTFDTIRWNALIGCAIALALIVSIVTDPSYKRWIKWGLGLFWLLVFMFCLIPD